MTILFICRMSFVELLNCSTAGRPEGRYLPLSREVQKWGDVATGIKLISVKASISVAEPSASHPTLVPLSRFSCDSRGHYHGKRRWEKDSQQHGDLVRAVTPGACQSLLHNMYTLLGLCSPRLGADFHLEMPVRVPSEQQSRAVSVAR